MGVDAVTIVNRVTSLRKPQPPQRLITYANDRVWHRELTPDQAARINDAMTKFHNGIRALSARLAAGLREDHP